ncbi:MAG TPA: DNA primase small subunit domain-containing protein [Actinomycetota bacterium]|nr:DNA primase small subunit domain-containing protein [Actinomycetota bacterium]
MPTQYEFLDLAGCEVRISNPEKIFWPKTGRTKLDLVKYYVAVAEGVMSACRERPTTMYRWPNGVEAPEDAFYQKRVPDKGRPDWLQTTVVHFPSGRSAEMPVVADAAHVAWLNNLGCIDLNPWPVLRADVDHPDELRVDLDPTPDVPFSDVCDTAPVVADVLREHGLEGYPKSSGKRGIHIYARIEPRWPFTEVRRAALALAREVERRMPGIATTAWWKEERQGVFVDYNQNARDRTIASAYSIRPVSDARVSCPLGWDEIEGLDPSEHTIETVPERLKEKGDLWAGINEKPASLEGLLALAAKDEAGGLGDAPWPPHFPKAQGEPRRVQPSKARKPKTKES